MHVFPALNNFKPQLSVATPKSQTGPNYFSATVLGMLFFFSTPSDVMMAKRGNFAVGNNPTRERHSHIPKWKMIVQSSGVG